MLNSNFNAKFLIKHKNSENANANAINTESPVQKRDKLPKLRIACQHARMYTSGFPAREFYSSDGALMSQSCQNS